MRRQAISSMDSTEPNGQAAFDGFDDAVMVVDVDFVAGFDEDDLGTEALGVGDDGAGFDAEGLGLVAGRNADRWCRPSWARRRLGGRAVRDEPPARRRRSRS